MPRDRETLRSIRYLARESRKQRTLSLYFDDAEIARMRAGHSSRMRLSANDVVVCGRRRGAAEGGPGGGPSHPGRRRECPKPTRFE